MNLPTMDEADLFAWLTLPTERGLRDTVLSLAARHGLIATERRWHEDRWVLRARSLAAGAVQAAWQRHPDVDHWADLEWPVLPDDVLEPDAPPVRDPSAEARCWLHEAPLPECGCPVMGRAAAPTFYERLTGEPQASAPFERALEPPASTAVVWRASCPACRRNRVQPDRPEHVCPECGHPWLCWRAGLDTEPRVEFALPPASSEETLIASGDSSFSHPGSTVEPGTYTRAEGTGKPAEESAPAALASPFAPTTASEGAGPVAPLPPGPAPSLASAPPARAPDSYMATYYKEQMRSRRGPVVAPSHHVGDGCQPPHSELGAKLRSIREDKIEPSMRARAEEWASLGLCQACGHASTAEDPCPDDCAFVAEGPPPWPASRDEAQATGPLDAEEWNRTVCEPLSAPLTPQEAGKALERVRADRLARVDKILRGAVAPVSGLGATTRETNGRVLAAIDQAMNVLILGSDPSAAAAPPAASEKRKRHVYRGSEACRNCGATKGAAVACPGKAAT